MVTGPPNLDSLLPKWTERFVTEMGGRDPLGLSRVSFLITDYLLKGIITTTNRARYYSFFCWALWHIEKEDFPKRYQDFVDGMRRREAMVALSTIFMNRESTPVGLLATKPQLEKGLEKGEINCNFRVLPSNPLGGYGQYYSGCMYELGLTYRMEDGIDRITQGIAEELAKSFDLSAMKTSYIKRNLYKSSYLRKEDFVRSAPYFTLDALSKSFASNEKELLIDLFFGLSKRNFSEATALRKNTLVQILHVISAYQQHGFPINLDNSREDFPAGKYLNWYIVYPLYYYGTLWAGKNKFIPYRIPKSLEFCYSLWRQFSLHQFLTQAIEILMSGFLETIGAEGAGLKLHDATRRLLQSEFFSTLKQFTGAKCLRPRQLLNAVGVYAQPDEEFCLKYRQNIPINHPASEIQALRLSESNPQVQVAKSLILLSILYAKWRGAANDPGYQYIAQYAKEELWAGNILPYIDKWLDSQRTWEEILEDMIDTFIINQHDRVMYEKRRLDSCWLHTVEGRIIKDQDYGSAWRSSRHSNVVNIFQDLNLLKVDDKGNMSVTSAGRRIMNKLLAN